MRRSCKLMNEKAVELGLKNTHFANTHGLDAPGHYTTAADLAVLGRYAMTKPRFREIVRMKSVTIGSGTRKETLQSTDLLIGNYAGAIGIKTGYTDAAGYSVLSAAQRGDLTLYAVVLGTSSELQRFREARELLDWGFAHYRASAARRRGHRRRRGSGDGLPRSARSGRHLAGRDGIRARSERADHAHGDRRRDRRHPSRRARRWVSRPSRRRTR